MICQLGGKQVVLPAFAALLAIASAMPGCGSSSEAAPLKKPQFVQQANAICRNWEDERKKALKEATEQSAGGEPELTSTVMEAVLPSIQKMTDELAELGAPRGDEKKVQGIIAEFERGIETLEEEPAEVPTDVAAFSKATEAAEAYGLTSCGI
jgi:hypothetical protein